MKTFDRLKYNKLCAEFLGGIGYNSPLRMFQLNKDEINLSFDLFDEKIFSNNGGSSWKIEDLKFDYDWNWIMEVVEKIKKNTTNPLSSFDTTFSTKRREIQTHLGRAHKEALIEAIWDFLNWYYSVKEE